MTIKIYFNGPSIKKVGVHWLSGRVLEGGVALWPLSKTHLS